MRAEPWPTCFCRPSGRLRSEVNLRAEITKGCRQLLAYLTNPKLIAALDRYIAEVSGAFSFRSCAWGLAGGLPTQIDVTFSPVRATFSLAHSCRSSDLDNVEPYLEVNDGTLREMFEVVLDL